MTYPTKNLAFLLEVLPLCVRNLFYVRGSLTSPTHAFAGSTSLGHLSLTIFLLFPKTDICRREIKEESSTRARCLPSSNNQPL